MMNLIWSKAIFNQTKHTYVGGLFIKQFKMEYDYVMICYRSSRWTTRSGHHQSPNNNIGSPSSNENWIFWNVGKCVFWPSLDLKLFPPMFVFLFSFVWFCFYVSMFLCFAPCFYVSMFPWPPLRSWASVPMFYVFMFLCFYVFIYFLFHFSNLDL